MFFLGSGLQDNGRKAPLHVRHSAFYRSVSSRMAAPLLPLNVLASLLSCSLVLLVLTSTSCIAEDVADGQRVLMPYAIAAGGGGSAFVSPHFFRAAFPAHFVQKPFLPRVMAMKRSLAIGRLQFRPGKRAVADEDNAAVMDSADLVGLMKRSAALGRIGFRYVLLPLSDVLLNRRKLNRAYALDQANAAGACLRIRWLRMTRAT